MVRTSIALMVQLIATSADRIIHRFQMIENPWHTHSATTQLKRMLTIGVLLAAMESSMKAQTYPYVLRELGTLGGSISYGHALNNLGQVTGVARTANSQDHAFISGPNGFGVLKIWAHSAELKAADRGLTIKAR